MWACALVLQQAQAFPAFNERTAYGIFEPVRVPMHEPRQEAVSLDCCLYVWLCAQSGLLQVFNAVFGQFSWMANACDDVCHVLQGCDCREREAQHSRSAGGGDSDPALPESQPARRSWHVSHRLRLERLRLASQCQDVLCLMLRGLGTLTQNHDCCFCLAKQVTYNVFGQLILCSTQFVSSQLSDAMFNDADTALAVRIMSLASICRT